MLWMACAAHSWTQRHLKAHHWIFLRKRFLKIDKRKVERFVGGNVSLLQLANNEYGISGAFDRHTAQLYGVGVQNLANVVFQQPLQQFYELFCKLETAMIAMLGGLTLTVVEVQNEALVSVCWDLTSTENSLHQLPWQLDSSLTSQHLSLDVGWVRDNRGIHHIAINIEQPTIVHNPYLDLDVITEHGLTPIISHTILASDVLVGLCSPYVWRYKRHHNHLDILLQITPSLPQTFTTSVPFY